MADITPSTPDPAITSLVFTLIRTVLAFLSGLGVVVGSYSDSSLMIIAGAVVTAATAAWGLWDKIRAARANHRNSVASVIAGKPVEVATP